MWCQRSDRVYVTIKVADCKGARLNITEDNVLEFHGSGHGMCGEREYELCVELHKPVVADECVWFVSGEQYSHTHIIPRSLALSLSLADTSISLCLFRPTHCHELFRCS